MSVYSRLHQSAGVTSCPGSVLILFKLPNGLIYLHTGDFRAHQRMELYPQLQNLRVHHLYLDTTYCDPKYDFPKQDSVVQFAVNTALRAVQENPKTLILCGTYTIGKEKVFKAISDALGCNICVESDKKRILSCYNDDQLMKKLVTDKKASRLHVVGMAKLNLKRLALYLEEFHGLFDNIVAFKPTGWTHSSKSNSLADIKPSKWGRIQIYGIPYSEHSSYSEMKRFVQFLRASGTTHIIPTVNVGRPDQRAFMESHFKDWMSQGNTSSGMNGHDGSQTRLHGTNAWRSATPSNPSKTLETFFKKK
ncbi:DNA cross-link repair 1A protein [Holothuria leucospilota]|uniref:DNA cross-link repair 1A protein n=1 Tax=Holothuria leucospilota TaxID=206669 RepID=A0A9Q0YS05_HOLLE|nr:DNA cross-link repair 1A protein [Holothuria leucospilota]